MQKIGYDFNWQNEGANIHMVFIKGYDLKIQSNKLIISMRHLKIISYRTESISETI